MASESITEASGIVVDRIADEQPGAVRNIDVIDVSAATSARVRIERVEMSRCSESEARQLFDEMGRVAAAAATPELPAGTGWAASRGPEAPRALAVAVGVRGSCGADPPRVRAAGQN